MFDRKNLKTAAKDRLRGNRGNAILVVLLTTLLGSLFSGGSIDWDNLKTDEELQMYLEAFSAGPEVLWYFLFSVIGIALVFAVAYSVFVGNVVDVGCRGWFMRFWRGELPSVGALFDPFRGIYWTAVKTQFISALYTFLWSLLFVIPGIVKAYAYSMTPYIIYENPHLTADEAITLSRRLTDGAKGELFLYDLSFFWWRVLDMFTFGILGVVYINPYHAAGHAAIYETLKWRAIQEGVVSEADFRDSAAYVTPEY